MMTCPTDDEIRRVAAEPDGPGIAANRRHVRACPACRKRLEVAVSGADVLADLRELHDRRQGVRPLVEEMTKSNS